MTEGIRAATLRGAIYLAAREGLGVTIRAVGVVVVTLVIGPADFGVFAGSLAIVTLLEFAAQMGCEVFLIRRLEPPRPEQYDAAFSVLLVSGAAAVVAGTAAAAAVAVAVDSTDFTAPFQVMLLAVPLTICWAPAQAMLERAYRFRSIAIVEVGGDVVLYAVAIPLALAGAGVWAPVAGFLAWRAWILVGAYGLAGHVPRWRWSNAFARELARYGLKYSPAGLLARAEYLINPLIVGPTLGAAAVGQVALALRLVDTLSFVLKIAWRLSVVALSKVQEDFDRLRRGFEDALSLQVMSQGPVLAAFAVCSPWLIPLVFGSEWEPVVDLFGLVALAGMLTALVSVHYALLYVRRRDRDVLVIAAIRVAAFAAAAVVLVPLAGIEGYGLAMLVLGASLLAARIAVRRTTFDYRLRPAALWLLAFAPALFVPLAGMPWGLLLLAPVPAAFVLPSTRSQLAEIVRVARARDAPGETGADRAEA
jgi:PST family polysaccharide transporter